MIIVVWIGKSYAIPSRYGNGMRYGIDSKFFHCVCFLQKKIIFSKVEKMPLKKRNKKTDSKNRLKALFRSFSIENVKTGSKLLFINRPISTKIYKQLLY